MLNIHTNVKDAWRYVGRDGYIAIFVLKGSINEPFMLITHSGTTVSFGRKKIAPT